MTHAHVDHDAARELELYAYNTYALDAQREAIRRNVARRIKNGTYDAEKAPALWQYWIDEAARTYCKEFGGDIRTTFPKVTREYVAQRVAVMEWTEIIEDVAHEIGKLLATTSGKAFEKAKEIAERATVPGHMIHAAASRYAIAS